jgi:starch phosphorylase
MKTFDAASPSEVPIGHVTNGIHPQSWIADEAQPFYEKVLKPKWDSVTPKSDPWKNADKASDEDLWALRHRLRQAFVTALRETLDRQLTYHGADQSHINALYDTLSDDALTIGFARRFATYKRAPLIFKDTRRIAAILGDAERPVQLVFAGKAHPRDEEGNAFVRKVHEMTRKPPFRGRVWFVENYDQSIGRMMTSGVDLWLNNPIRPMEASGTSGMKPCLNAGVNASVLDGWWPEGYREDRKNGWAIGSAEPRASRAKQDKFDADSIYSLLEEEIVPSFYERDASGVPRKWVELMRNSMVTNGQKFSAHRMIGDYVKSYYAPAHRA